MNKEVGLYLGVLIGKVNEIDASANGECLGKFIRVRVMINVLKPLKRGIRVAVRMKGIEDCNVLLCYKRLPNFCYYCGCLGHLIRYCTVNDKGLVDDSDLRFSMWLRAPSSRRSKVFGDRYKVSKKEGEAVKTGVAVAQANI
ncbi:hypothetical protein ACOSP7_018846 [Xanthoceras sorbifolium]